MEPLSFGAWCDREYGFEYSEVRSHSGLAFFPFLKENNKIIWEKNENYFEQELIIKSPRIYKEFGLTAEKPIYIQFEEDMEKFNFVPRPDLFKDKWGRFTP
jgi:glucose-6-phosphate isomerase